MSGNCPKIDNINRINMAKMFAPPGAECDYSEYTSAGFPTAQPVTDSRARELRQNPAEILVAEYLQTKERNKRKRNERAKDIKDAKWRFAYALCIDHGLQTYTWPDGLSVRIAAPHLQSGRRWSSA